MNSVLTKSGLFLLLISWLVACTSKKDQYPFSPVNDGRTPATNEKSPNIIYILADDLGYGDVSAYNPESKINTRNLDRLASTGVLFTDAHTCSSVCTPTRYSILTGRYNWRSTLKEGVLDGYSKPLIDISRKTVGQMLQESGYHTAFIGKWHLGWDWTYKSGTAEGHRGNDVAGLVDWSAPVQNGPNTRGFDYSYGFSASLDMAPYVYVENGRITAAPNRITQSVDGKAFWRMGPTGEDFDHVKVLPHVTDKAVQYIRERAGSQQPFFLYFALPAPHTPIVPTTEFFGKSNTNMYGDFVLMVDDVVGSIVGTLEELGIRENTMLVFVSDNGCSPMADFPELEEIGHRPSYIFRGSKADLYEGGHRVPYIVSWPKMIKGGFVSDQLLTTTDFFATTADLVGYKITDNMAEDSYSYLPLLLNKNFNGSMREAAVHHSYDGKFAIRQGDWKLLLTKGSGGWSFPRYEKDIQGLPAVQLFNLKDDPAESTNLQAKFPEKVKELNMLLISYIEKGRSTPGSLQQNDSVKQWPQLMDIYSLK